MLVLARRGFTLVELMIALVLLGIVSAAVYKVLVNSQRVYLAQTQTIDLQQNIRAAAAILPAEFRELDAADGDIKGMTATSLRIRAMRVLAFVCADPVLGGGIGQIVLTVRQTPIYGTRQTFSKGDSIMVYWEGNPTSRNDDQWLAAQLQQDATPGFCADSNVANNPAYLLTLQPQWINDPSLNRAGAITRGAPLRGFDKIAYELYQAPAPDTNWYLGQRNPASGGTIQPMIGPLIGPNGVTFSYYDSVGAVTADSSKVAQIGFVLRARTASPIRSAGTGKQAYKIDSVVSWVALRNNPRCGPRSLPPSPCN
ncbi:MAG TPA: prepilin-type N-terminal cleavage/methylation domain-containing protein [Gemmatimonadales bacterium]|jgi:prepilin-type N-terminal cleavage/methylation domain-containing protein